MTVDLNRVSEGPANEGMVRRFLKGGWALFAKADGEWRCYHLDGEEGIIEDEAVARELYGMAVKHPKCQAAVLVRVATVERCVHGPKEWSPRK